MPLKVNIESLIKAVKQSAMLPKNEILAADVEAARQVLAGEQGINIDGLLAGLADIALRDGQVGTEERLAILKKLAGK